MVFADYVKHYQNLSFPLKLTAEQETNMILPIVFVTAGVLLLLTGLCQKSIIGNSTLAIGDGRPKAPSRQNSNT